jgi:SET domain-containing protein
MNWLTPKAQARPAGEKGWGSFAVEKISAGETVAGFGGWCVTRAMLDELPEDRQHRSIQVDENLYLVSRNDREAGDCINHSCAPNCGLMGSTILVAMHDIEIGDELCFDYATCDDSDYDEFRCECGTADCRQIVTGLDWKRLDLRTKYDGYFSSYLAKKIKNELTYSSA